MMREKLPLALITLLTAVGAAAQEEPSTFNMPYGVTQASRGAYDMHMLVFWISVVIGVGVLAVMSWSLIRHRRSRGVTPSRFSENARLEQAWKLGAALVLVAISVPATTTLLTTNSHPDPDVVVDVEGSQWKWHYRYPEEDIAFHSNLAASSREANRKGSGVSPASVPNYLQDVDEPLVLPVDRNVRLRITATDVVHSWWVPELGFKRDAIPGFVNRADIVIDKPGTYRGQCAELCGAGHALMPVVVKAVPPAEFDAWVADHRRQAAEEQRAAEKEWTRSRAMKQGEQVYASLCASCHQANGEGVPGQFPPLDGNELVNGPVADHLDIVIHGSQQNPLMQAFGTQLSDRELAAVITYERNAWSNETGDLVTPEQVEAAR